MSVKRKQCFKCENGAKACPAGATGNFCNKALPPENIIQKNCAASKLEISVVSYYCKVKTVNAEDIPRLTDHIIQQHLEAKHADHEARLQEQMAIQLENNKTKQLLIKGSFWLGALSAVFYLLILAAGSNIDWGKFLVVLLILPFLFTLLGVFILRSIDGLKEEKFTKLVRLTLQLNFKVIKRLLKRKKNE